VSNFFIKSQLHQRHSLTEQYLMNVINSLCIVFIVLCIFCAGVDLVILQSLLYWLLIYIFKRSPDFAIW